ncbi:META domain-containing protein [Paraferrimonas sedimenticola]|uniref:Heat-shock protein HslJ n=1 Tax=Paraferrimonas sedimenticola TaxID=375674 RepID=A0AA37VZJ2_9GAMM|nr:META domain-containing protein [Paraferrimonas sedimenticola]GLP97269.1 heat-shock protein HslJ [Paraferrimonas sedimenticola]
MKRLTITALLLSSLFGCASQSDSATEAKTLDLQGNWHIEYIGDMPVIDYSPAKVMFQEEGKLSGNTSCNQFFGSYQQQGESLTISPAGTTMKACVDALMEQEQRTMQALSKVTQARMNKGRLEFLDQASGVVMILTKMD